MGFEFLGNSDSIVRDDKFILSPALHNRCHFPYPQADSSSLRRILNGVGKQVHKDLLETPPV